MPAPVQQNSGPWAVHDGMPAVPSGPRYPWFRRSLPDKVFYILPTLMWIALSARYGSLTVPTAANPDMEVGGLWGEEKSQGLGLFGAFASGFLPPSLSFVRGDDPSGAAEMARLRALMATAGVAYPVVVKPERGYQGWGVRLVRTPEALQTYLSGVTPGAALILQTFIRYEGEAGIFYVRDPSAAKGRILSMALTYAPFVVGDGSASLRQLVQADPILRKSCAVFADRLGAQFADVPGKGVVTPLTNTRSARLGAVYVDATDAITPALSAVIDQIAADIPNFCFGRFDVRFRSLDALRRGEDFQIVELNGAGAEMLDIWAADKGLWQAYRGLWRQYRLLFAIGAAMRRAGHRPETLAGMVRHWRRQEVLRQHYPQSG